MCACSFDGMCRFTSTAEKKNKHKNNKNSSPPMAVQNLRSSAMTCTKDIIRDK
jgi:hypothetical protein